MSESICEGARGYLVGKLQRAMGLKADEAFGPKTEAAVRALQVKHQLDVTGDADRNVYDVLGLKFPSEFERCLNLTGVYEGTGFGGINKRDIDGAGVTLGIVGFTTAHGEVQRLVREYLRMRPTAVNTLPVYERGKLMALVRSANDNREAWDRWFYGYDAVVDQWIRDVVAGWGRDEAFQLLQKAIIETDMWLPAQRAAKAMGLDGNMAALALLFDVQVQNGGWKERHKRHYNALSLDGSVASKLRAMAQTVAACATPRWQQDVGRRKMTFVSGGGEVHGRYHDLVDYGFDPLLWAK